MSSTLDDFFGDGNLIRPTEVTPELQTVIENWQAAIAQRQIGFLPRSFGGRVYWYAFAPTARERRELLDLLDSWVGPTYSDLPRHRGDLNLSDPFDVVLHNLPTPPLRFEVLPRIPPASTFSRDHVRGALLVLSRMVAGRPSSEFDAPRTTVEVLDDLGHAIAAQDRRVALDCLRELEATADLDQSNLAFLRLRLYAGLQDWASILADHDLEHVLAMRRPLGVTRIIQRAVYAAYFAAADESGRSADLLTAASALPQLFQALSSGAATTQRSDVVVELLLAVQLGKPQPVLDRLLAEASHIEPGLDRRLRDLLPSDGSKVVKSASTASHESHVETTPEAGHNPPSTAVSEVEVEAPFAEASQLATAGEFQAAINLALTLKPAPEIAGLLLLCARELETPDSVASVAAYLDQHELRPILESEDRRIRVDLAWLDRANRPTSILGWRGWFETLGDSNLSGFEVDPEAIASWEPLDRPELTQLLFEAPDELLGRFGEQGGAFMAAHREVFLESGAADLSERVLAGLAISSKNSIGARVQTLALLDFLAESQPSLATLTSALEWTGEVIAANVSAITATWAVDVLQTATCGATATALSPKCDLFFQVVNLVRPVKSALDLSDLEGIKVVAGELGLEPPDDFFAGLASDSDVAAPFRHLEGRSIVLYSLTETATTRAAQTLRRILPGIDVKTSAEYVGSPQLAAASANADVFVVVTASAKHAATDFIKASRGRKPLIQVNSRGSSAILRALAEG